MTMTDQDDTKTLERAQARLAQSDPTTEALKAMERRITRAEWSLAQIRANKEVATNTGGGDTTKGPPV
jgi:hypothetical protein